MVARSSSSSSVNSGVGEPVGAEQSLLLAVALDQVYEFGGTTGQAEIAKRFVIYGEEGRRGPELRRHVGNGGAIRQAERAETFAGEFDKAAYNAVLTQHLCHRQHQIGGGGALGHCTRESHADDFGRQQIERLAKQTRPRPRCRRHPSPECPGH